MQRIAARAIEALKFSAADILAEQKLHRLAALWAGWGRDVFGHSTLADQAGVLPNSLSPINAQDGTAITKAKAINLWLSARSPTQSRN